MTNRLIHRREFLRLSLVLAGSALATACQPTRPGSTPTATAAGPSFASGIRLQGGGADAWTFVKSIKGSLFGDCNPTTDIPKILGLYQSGDLKLDEIITRTYTLDEVNEGYDDLLAGKNVRGVVVHEH